ncbi:MULTISPECIES: efflux RND transporter periplasmic adaptor subunit [unclassified Guyparkeria]|uniref:efflux RND transporter periplasmic adaptor subunit n=1 Tax=unclassified Guyparkeria TaxID=2626246 RepID=UPI0018D220BB|nr:MULTISPECIES: efflux RND transporter periplasmic adaptor subunit [unclassified Guyparkeria]
MAKLFAIARAALTASVLLSFTPSALAESDQRPVVLVAPIAAGVEPRPPLVGSVVAETNAAVGFQAAGRISERLVRRGERVEQGEPLARLDERDLAARVDSARAALEQARADARLAEQELERIRTLFEQQVASRQALDQAESRAQATASRVTSAEAQLAEARNALDYASLAAPFDGVVTGLSADVGDVVAAGQPVVRLAADEGRLVEVAVPERRRADLAERAEARLEADGATAEVSLDTISGAADPVSRSYAARYRLADSAAGMTPWSLGQTAILSFTREGARHQRVPVGAVFARDDQPRVFRVLDGRLEAVEVTLRRIDVDYALIDSELPAGTLVVIAGVNRLHDGQAVRVRRGDEVATGAGESAP